MQVQNPTATPAPLIQQWILNNCREYGQKERIKSLHCFLFGFGHDDSAQMHASRLRRCLPLARQRQPNKKHQTKKSVSRCVHTNTRKSRVRICARAHSNVYRFPPPHEHTHRCCERERATQSNTIKLKYKFAAWKFISPSEFVT